MANELRETFQDIADAIRGKTGGTDKMAPSDMAAQIGSITAGGGCNHTVIEGAEVELYLVDGDQTVNLPDGVVAKSAVIKKPATLLPENIVQGVEIAGVEGSHQDPEVIVDAEVPLYMADGDMVVEMPEGYVVQSAIIKKPETLIPENIAKDVNIAGVIGTHEGGGGDVPAGYVTVTFMNGGDVLFSRMVLAGDDCPDPYVQSRIELPTKESTAQYTYTFNGWATADGGSADSTVLKNITEDKTLYAAFNANLVYFTVNFYDGDTLLKTEQVAYGNSSTYQYVKPGYEFKGWTPTPTNVTANMDCYGEWEESLEITDSWDEIIAAAEDGTYATKYKIGQYKPIDLGSEGVIRMQLVFTKDSNNYAGLKKEFLYDDASTPASMTFVAIDLLATRKPMYTENTANTATGSFGWSGSDLRAYLQDTIKPLLPSNVAAAIKTVRKYTHEWVNRTRTYNVESAEDLWIPSVYEMYYSSQTGYEQYGAAYRSGFGGYYKDDAALAKAYADAGEYANTAGSYWLRSVNKSATYTDASKQWMSIVSTNGTPTSTLINSSSRGVCIGFCI